MVALVVAGWTNKATAGKFAVTGNTVKHHVTNIFDAMHHQLV